MDCEGANATWLECDPDNQENCPNGQESYTFCNWASGLDSSGSGCTEDCDAELLIDLALVQSTCTDCESQNSCEDINWSEVLDDGAADGGGIDCGDSVGGAPVWDADGDGNWDNLYDFQNNGSITSAVYLSLIHI